MELRNWQQRAVKFFFENDGTALMNVPTGAGKTFVAIYIIKKLIEKEPRIRILIVVPKLVIIDKTWVPELLNAGFHWGQIGIYTGDTKEFAKITLTTNASITKINLKIFDLFVADEIHNMGTDRLQKVIDFNFKYKLGLSATPDRSDWQHWKIYKSFDFKTFEYKISEALNEGVLNKFDFCDIVLELEEMERDRYDNLSMVMGSLMKAIGGFNRFRALPNSDPRKRKLMKIMAERKDMIWNHVEKLRVVSALCKEYKKDSKIIVFSQYSSMTNSLYYYMGSEGVKSGVIHSNLKDAEKEKALNDFKTGKINVLLATKMLDEGYNLPSIDVGIILAGERTHRQTIQRMGRVLRKKDKKSKLIQVFVRDTFESENAEERSIFFQKYCEKYEKIEVGINE